MNFDPHEVKDEIIDEYLEALGRDYAAMDFQTFSDTIDLYLYDPLIAEPWTKLHTFLMLDAVERAKMGFQQVGSLFSNPSTIRNMLSFDLFRAKCAGFGMPIYLRIFKFYSDVLCAVCLEDPFVKEKKNIIHTSQEVAGMVARCQPANPDIARKLGRLANACYNLSYGLYSDMNPQLVYDNFGPYYQPDGKMFALKIFHNLKPVELWPETNMLSVDNIDIWALFEGVSLEVDYATHAIYRGDQIQGLRGWRCTADGHLMDINEIDVLRQSIEEVSVKIYTKYKLLDFEAKKELYWHQQAYSYKRLFDVLGLGWKPHSEIISAARGKPLFRGWNIPDDKEKAAELFRAIWDPRKEIPREASKI